MAVQRGGAPPAGVAFFQPCGCETFLTKLNTPWLQGTDKVLLHYYGFDAQKPLLASLQAVPKLHVTHHHTAKSLSMLLADRGVILSVFELKRKGGAVPTFLQQPRSRVSAPSQRRRCRNIGLHRLAKHVRCPPCCFDGAAQCKTIAGVAFVRAVSSPSVRCHRWPRLAQGARIGVGVGASVSPTVGMRLRLLRQSWWIGATSSWSAQGRNRLRRRDFRRLFSALLVCASSLTKILAS